MIMKIKVNPYVNVEIEIGDKAAVIITCAAFGAVCAACIALLAGVLRL